MKIIDAHMHLCNIHGFDETAKASGGENSLSYVMSEFKKNNIITGIGMGNVPLDGDYTKPLVLDLNAKMELFPYNYPDTITCCLGVHGAAITKENQKQILGNFADALACNHAVGLKIYAGYEPYYLLNWRYRPFYDLAAQMRVPVVIHTGETVSQTGRLKYAHPLLVDDAAVKFPQTQFVIAHYGSPWILDAGQVAGKNPNVAIDLSGLIEGDIDADAVLSEQSGYWQYIKTWTSYLELYDRLLYGSDWPLVNMGKYIELISRLFPERYWDDIFYNNARRVFGRIATRGADY
jgi:hypothetical protein